MNRTILFFIMFCTFLMAVSACAPSYQTVPVELKKMDRSEAKKLFLDKLVLVKDSSTWFPYQAEQILTLYKAGTMEFIGVKTAKNNDVVVFLFRRTDAVHIYGVILFKLSYNSKEGIPLPASLAKSCTVDGDCKLELISGQFCAGATVKEPIVEGNKVQIQFANTTSSDPACNASPNGVSYFTWNMLNFNNENSSKIDDFISVFASAFRVSVVKARQ